MELIKINDQKLKIMLTPSDMTHYELNIESIGKDGEQMQRAIRGLMSEIRKELGIDFDDRRISVQYFPSKEGGCEMFISSILSKSEGEKEKRLLSAPNRRALLPKSKPTEGSFLRDSAYRINNLCSLLSACLRLYHIGYNGESDVFREDSGSYILFLRAHCPSPFSVPDEWAFLAEYGKAENASLLRIYLREHGTLVSASRAVETLAAFK